MGEGQAIQQAPRQEGEKMRICDVHTKDESGAQVVHLSDVRSLLLDLVLAQADGCDDSPLRLIGDERIRVARVSRIAEMCTGDSDSELLLDLVGAAKALDEAQTRYGEALATLEEWKEGEGFV